MSGNSLQSKYERNSLWSHRLASFILLGLAVEIIGVFIPLVRPWIPGAVTITSASLIWIGVWGELHFSAKAREAGDAIVAEANARAAEANERAANADLARIKLEKQLTARTLTKEQFDVLQKLGGKISAVIVASDADSEPAWFANLIAIALQKAGIEVGLVTRAPHAHSTANFVCDRRAFANPDGEPTNGEPLVSVFNEAGIPLSGIASVRPTDLPSDDPDVPMIVIGGRFAVPPIPPYLGPDGPAPPPTMLERIRNP